MVGKHCYKSDSLSLHRIFFSLMCKAEKTLRFSIRVQYDEVSLNHFIKETIKQFAFFGHGFPTKKNKARTKVLLLLIMFDKNA